MAITDSLSSPATNTTFNVNADCHIIVTWTAEATATNQVIIEFRRSSSSNLIKVTLGPSWDPDRVIAYRRESDSDNDLSGTTGVLSDGISYRADIYADGDSIITDVDDVEVTNDTESFNQTQTGGMVRHTLDTNDIELESWPLGEPAAGVEFAATVAAVTDTRVGHGS